MPDGASTPAVRAPGAVSAERASARLEAVSETIRRRELERAYHRLEATDAPVEPHARDVLEQLSRSLVDGLMAGVHRELGAADGRATVEHAVGLFGLVRRPDVPPEPRGTAAVGELQTAAQPPE